MYAGTSDFKLDSAKLQQNRVVHMLSQITTTAYHSPSPFSEEVLCDSLLDGPAAAAQQAQVAAIHEEVPVYACFLQVFGGKLHPRYTGVSDMPQLGLCTAPQTLG